MAEENNQPEIKSQVTGADSSKRGLRLCPACGNTKYHRTKRSTLEHLLLRPRMARCEKCGFRFPHPGRNEEYPAPLKVVEPKTIVPRPAEERSAPKMAEESSRPKITQEVRVVDYSNSESRCCPHCGKCKYHRSKPTTLDKILLRPAMAHCEVCGERFPYPKHDKPRDSVKSRAESATVSPVGEGGKASGTTADSSKRRLPRCPACGGTSYRRSRRTTLERILLRPRMARCRNCRKRFPYPKT